MQSCHVQCRCNIEQISLEVDVWNPCPSIESYMKWLKRKKSHAPSGVREQKQERWHKHKGEDYTSGWGSEYANPVHNTYWKNASVVRYYGTCMHRGLGTGDWRGKKRKKIIYSYCIHLLMEIFFKYVQRWKIQRKDVYHQSEI